MRPVYVLGARRSRVAPRGGGFARLEVWDLGAAVLRATLADAGRGARDVEGVVMGNALYGGGNPARMAALAAGLPEAALARTIDTQCCSGLDAVACAAGIVGLGEADLFLAGGLESFSRAPIRMRRPAEAWEKPVAYDRPPFAPDPARDPEPEAADRALATERGYDFKKMADFAMRSHALARNAAERLGAEIASTPFAGRAPRYADPFTRDLTPELCQRAGRSAVMSVEADAAAALALSACRPRGDRIRFLGAAQSGGDPQRPWEGAILATTILLERLGLKAADLTVVELMESFAAQAIAWIEEIGADQSQINRGGGALARGHPIGASGAVLAVRLYHELLRMPPGTIGLATIPAVGGLGSALAMIREVGE